MRRAVRRAHLGRGSSVPGLNALREHLCTWLELPSSPAIILRAPPPCALRVLNLVVSLSLPPPSALLHLIAGQVRAHRFEAASGLRPPWARPEERGRPHAGQPPPDDEGSAAGFVPTFAGRVGGGGSCCGGSSAERQPGGHRGDRRRLSASGRRAPSFPVRSLSTHPIASCAWFGRVARVGD